MAFTGDVITVEEALGCGLISKIVKPDDLMAEAKNLAARIAKNPARTLRMSKRLMREAAHVRLDTLLEMSATYQAIAHKTDEHLERLGNISLGKDKVKK
jgi:enoyl-CoA hydratase/carnithine racemase